MSDYSNGDLSGAPDAATPTIQSLARAGRARLSGNGELRILLVARSMDGAKLVKTVLEGRPKGYLEARRALFVADISGMPSLIGKLFAIPAMRVARLGSRPCR